MRKRKRRVLLILSLTVLLLAITGILKHETLLEKLEEFLILDENPKPVSVIIVIGGAHGQRVEYAVKLFKQGYSNKIIVSGGKCSWNSTAAEIMKEHAMFLGVPEENIFTEKDARTTYENAKYSLDLMAVKGLKSAIVITSPTHTRRTSIIFNSFAKKRKMDLTICAAPYKRIYRKWWQDDIGVQRVIIEYAKLFYYYLLQRKHYRQISENIIAKPSDANSKANID